MCVVCGCSNTGSAGAPEASARGDLHYGTGPAGARVPGLSAERTVR